MQIIMSDYALTFSVICVTMNIIVYETTQKGMRL